MENDNEIEIWNPTRQDKVELVKAIIDKNIKNALQEINCFPDIKAMYGTLPYLDRKGNTVTKGHILVIDSTNVIKDTNWGLQVYDRLYVTGIDTVSEEEVGLKVDELNSCFTDPNTVGV